MAYTLRGKISNITPLTLDKTLTLEGASADAKAVGDAINEAKKTLTAHTDEHANRKDNPHNVTVEQLGLENVNNTSDLEKPVSHAQATAIADAKKAGTDAQTAAENAQKSAENAEQNAKAYAKEYADSLRKPFTVYLPASGWSETAPYKQTVAVEGILETDAPHWGLVYSSDVPDTEEEDEAVRLVELNVSEKEAYALIDDLDTADGSVTFTCLEDKPEVDLTIQMEVNR